MGRYPTHRKKPKKKIYFGTNAQTGNYFYIDTKGGSNIDVPGNDINSFVNTVVAKQYAGREFSVIVIPAINRQKPQ